MFALLALFVLLLIAVCYVGIVFILVKGKQYNRYFATFLCTIFPVVGSIPAYIIASKYEKIISSHSKKINDNILRYVIIAMQVVSILLLLAPYYITGTDYVSVFKVIFGSTTYGGVIKPLSFLSFLIVLPILSALLNFFNRKNNICNFITYLVSFINLFSLLAYSFIVTSLQGVVLTYSIWLYAFWNLFIMALSMVSLVVKRDEFLFKLEYSEKIDLIKEQKQKEEKIQEELAEKNTYKCSKCGNKVLKGTQCKCTMSNTIVVPKNKNFENTLIVSKFSDNDKSVLPDSYCVYCKKPLGPDEKCNCQGDGFGISVKNESKSERKCMYCGKTLVGDAVCVCEKIMKNSTESKGDIVAKKYFESQIEKSDVFIADELAQLEQRINSKFENIKESIESSAECVASKK